MDLEIRTTAEPVGPDSPRAHEARAYVRELVARRGWTDEIEREGQKRFEALMAARLCEELDRRFVT